MAAEVKILAPTSLLVPGTCLCLNDLPWMYDSHLKMNMFKVEFILFLLLHYISSSSGSTIYVAADVRNLAGTLDNSFSPSAHTELSHWCRLNILCSLPPDIYSGVSVTLFCDSIVGKNHHNLSSELLLSSPIWSPNIHSI